MLTSLFLSTAFTLLQGMAVYNHVHFAELLLSKNWEQRREAYWFARKAEWSLRVSATEFMLNVIKRNHFVPRRTKLDNDDDAQCTPRNVAIAILAEWALPEATSVLIENIVHPSELFNPPGVITRNESDLNLPMRALIHMGKQVAKPVLKELAVWDPRNHHTIVEYHSILERRSHLIKVLEKVLGYRQARQRVQEEAKRLQFLDRFAYANLINVDEIIKRHENVVDP